MLLQLPLFTELDQLVFMILHKSVQSTRDSGREPVTLLPEQVDFCLQGLNVSLRVFVVLAKRMRESISVIYHVFEFLLGLLIVFYDFSLLIHQAMFMESALTDCTKSVSYF